MCFWCLFIQLCWSHICHLFSSVKDGATLFVWISSVPVACGWTVWFILGCWDQMEQSNCYGTLFFFLTTIVTLFMIMVYSTVLLCRISVVCTLCFCWLLTKGFLVFTWFPSLFSPFFAHRSDDSMSSFLLRFSACGRVSVAKSHCTQPFRFVTRSNGKLCSWVCCASCCDTRVLFLRLACCFWKCRDLIHQLIEFEYSWIRHLWRPSVLHSLASDHFGYVVMPLLVPTLTLSKGFP